MNSRRLPKGWVEKKLEDVCSIKHGFAFKSEFFTFEKSDYVLLTPGSFYEGGGYREQCEKTKYYVGKIPDGFILNKGNFLFAMTEQAVGLLGSPLIVPESDKFLHNQRLGLVQVSDGVDWYNDFFFHQFNTQEFRSAVQSSASGVKVRHTSPNKLGAIVIRFPPSIAEQKAIADNLNEAFEGIDRAIANTQKNLTNARELFESYLNAIFTQNDNKWEWVSLSSITNSITDGNHQPPPKSQSGIPFITISNINKQDRKIDFSNTFKVSPEYFEKLKENWKPRKGDLLYTVTGSYGIPVVVDCDLDFCFQRHIGLIKPNEQTNSKCLYYIFLSRYLLNQADTCATGTAQKTVSLGALRQFSVPKIPIEEQETIVAELDILLAQTKRLEAIYRQKLAALNELKQSILQKAFTGELTADTAHQTTKEAEATIAA
jgi:type I restriction enzyme, S subunit